MKIRWCWFNILLSISLNVLAVCETFEKLLIRVWRLENPLRWAVTSHFHWLANKDVGAGREEETDWSQGKAVGIPHWQLSWGQAVSFNMAGTKALLMLENFIDGKFVPCNSYIDSYDPSTGEVYCRVPDSGKEEVSNIHLEKTEMVLNCWWIMHNFTF